MRAGHPLVRALRGLALLLALWPTPGATHAAPARFEPRPGAILRAAPSEVRVWFDGDLEPAFSTLRVTDAASLRVDRGDARVDAGNRRLLRVGLPALPPGTYRVAWRVLAVDGHRTQGDYRFTIKAAE